MCVLCTLAKTSLLVKKKKHDSSFSGRLFSSECSTSRFYQTTTPHTGVTWFWNHGGKSSLVSGLTADLWTSTCSPSAKSSTTEISHFPSKKAGVCVCECVIDEHMCMHVFYSLCLLKHLKMIEDITPFKDIMSAFGLVCVCVWEGNV